MLKMINVTTVNAADVRKWQCRSCGDDVMQDSCVLELHQSFGTDYQTLAACHLKLHDVLERSNGRLHGTVSLTGQ